jgi:hypothetical protein
MKRWVAFITGALITGSVLYGCAQQHSAPTGAGWVTLFDGSRSSLANWYAIGDANWTVTEGVAQADRKGKQNGFLFTRKPYADFQLYAEFWVSEDANSGIFIRCRDQNKITADTCYEVNIYDKAPDAAFGTGSIVRFATVKPVHKAGGQWNVYEITARGSKITATLNGERTVELDNKKFKSGVIALQYAAGTVKFRKVMIRAL